jgi:hypothetical protein
MALNFESMTYVLIRLQQQLEIKSTKLSCQTWYATHRRTVHGNICWLCSIKLISTWHKYSKLVVDQVPDSPHFHAIIRSVFLRFTGSGPCCMCLYKRHVNLGLLSQLTPKIGWILMAHSIGKLHYALPLLHHQTPPLHRAPGGHGVLIIV